MVVCASALFPSPPDAPRLTPALDGPPCRGRHDRVSFCLDQARSLSCKRGHGKLDQSYFDLRDRSRLLVRCVPARRSRRFPELRPIKCLQVSSSVLRAIGGARRQFRRYEWRRAPHPAPGYSVNKDNSRQKLAVVHTHFHAAWRSRRSCQCPLRQAVRCDRHTRCSMPDLSCPLEPARFGTSSAGWRFAWQAGVPFPSDKPRLASRSVEPWDGGHGGKLQPYLRSPPVRTARDCAPSFRRDLARASAELSRLGEGLGRLPGLLRISSVNDVTDAEPHLSRYSACSFFQMMKGVIPCLRSSVLSQSFALVSGYVVEVAP